MTLEARIYQTLAPILAKGIFPLKAPPIVAQPYCVQMPISNTPICTLDPHDDWKDHAVLPKDI